MADSNKKMAAALAAVNAYLQQEDEIIQQKFASEAPLASTQQTDFNIWGLSGRQEMMSMRQLIQMKAFSRF